MINEENYWKAVARLKSELSKLKAGRTYDMVKENQREFLSYCPSYQTLFKGISPSINLDNLKKTCLEFLPEKTERGNRHWSGLNRNGGKATKNMEVLRDGLIHLLDESVSIEERFESVTSKNGGMKVDGMGKAIATAILFVTYPEKYGIWNGRSEKTLRKLKIFPSKHPLGSQYKAINDLLISLRNNLEIDMWMLDALLGHLAEDICLADYF